MKLSVKLLSGLTLMALIAVAVVGLSHSASAAVDGKIYITNKASNLTTESPAPSGRTATSTVYGTYDSTSRDIIADSDKFIVTVVDPDLNSAPLVLSNETVYAVDGTTVTTAGTGYDYLTTANGALTPSAGVIPVFNPDGLELDDVGDQFRLVLDSHAKPLVGSLSDVKIVTSTSTTTAYTEAAGLTVSEIFAAGDGTANSKGIITVNVTGTVTAGATIQVLYPTSDVDTTIVSVKSVVMTSGFNLTLEETDRNTGRFEGEIQVKQLGDGTGGTLLVGGASTVNGDLSVIQIPAQDGLITVNYTDAATSGTATGVTRTVSASLDITPPTATFTGPANAAETQNRTPSFTGNVNDSQSGIDKSTFALYIDQRDDPLNNGLDSSGNALAQASGLVIVDDTTINGTNANVVLTGVSDGDNSASFSHTPSGVIPTNAPADPSHTVDYQVKVADLAGNYGYSDADTSATNTDGYLSNKPHTIKIDQKIPVITSSKTGLAYNAETPTTDLEKVRDAIKVEFDGNLKSSSVSASDFKVTFSTTGAVFVPASVIVSGKNVYIDLDTTIPSNDTPTVSLQGTVQDVAGNSTDAGSSSAADGLPPVLTVTRSGGSGSGTGSEGPDSLTKKAMTITVTSDEDLTAPPTIQIKNITTPGGGVQPVFNNGVSTGGIPQGGNVWKLTFETLVAGEHAVKVAGTDKATVGNLEEVGNLTSKAYVVDNAVQSASLSPNNGGTTTQSNPFITVDFTGDDSTLSVVSATLDGADVTSGVIASADKKKFFYQPATALANGSHSFQLKVKDAAGNEDTVGATGSLYTFTKSSRTDFDIQLFAGWNSVSVPSNPIDNSIGSVFSNAGVKQVIAYDATTPAQPWRIASKVDGSFSSQTEPGLTSISPGHGYWVETSDFENQKVALHGPTGPGDARPGLITIPTGNGWNFVGVVDQSRIQTQAISSGAALKRPDSTGQDQNVDAEAYFNTVNAGRAYTFDTVDSEFRNLVLKTAGGATSDDMTIGSGVWVFISPQENGKLPHIVP